MGKSEQFRYNPLEGERDQPQISVDAEALYDLLTGKYGFKFNKLKHKYNDKTRNRRQEEFPFLSRP